MGAPTCRFLRGNYGESNHQTLECTGPTKRELWRFNHQQIGICRDLANRLLQPKQKNTGSYFWVSTRHMFHFTPILSSIFPVVPGIMYRLCGMVMMVIEDLPTKRGFRQPKPWLYGGHPGNRIIDNYHVCGSTKRTLMGPRIWFYLVFTNPI